MRDSGDVFARVYDRVVRRFWATNEAISEREFRLIVEAEGLTYPAAVGRAEPTPTPNELLREASFEVCPASYSHSPEPHRWTSDTADGIVRCVKCSGRLEQ